MVAVGGGRDDLGLAWASLRAVLAVRRRWRRSTAARAGCRPRGASWSRGERSPELGLVGDPRALRSCSCLPPIGTFLITGYLRKCQLTMPMIESMVYRMTTSEAPAAYRTLASLILEDVHSDAGVRWFGDRKVFLSTVPGIDLTDADCRSDLEVMRRAGLLQFSRADLVAAMDPELVAASEWQLDGATMHFLAVPVVAKALRSEGPG
jgi:hypothetical protein